MFPSTAAKEAEYGGGRVGLRERVGREGRMRRSPSKGGEIMRGNRNPVEPVFHAWKQDNCLDWILDMDRMQREVWLSIDSIAGPLA